MIIMKFGGSSLASSARIKAVSEIISSQLEATPLVVVSAMGDTTDWLLTAGEEALKDILNTEPVKNLHQNTLRELNLELPEVNGLLSELENLLKGISLVKEISSHTRDYLVSFGERMSARILAAQLCKQGIKAQAFDAWDLGFQTFESSHGHEFDPQSSGRIRELSLQVTKDGITPIITGYIAKSNKGAMSTLGRGGSDLTATILGSILGVAEVQVWKDVNGILSADPRVVDAACEVRELSFDEASELAYFGTQVLHPRAIRPVLNSNIPVRVKNSYNPEHPGSIISRTPAERKNPVHLITSKSPVTLIDLVSSQMLGPHGYLSELFQIFEKHQVSVDLLASSDISVSLTLDSQLRSFCYSARTSRSGAGKCK
jgi:aspartate kinase